MSREEHDTSVYMAKGLTQDWIGLVDACYSRISFEKNKVAHGWIALAHLVVIYICCILFYYFILQSLLHTGVQHTSLGRTTFFYDTDGTGAFLGCIKANERCEFIAWSGERSWTSLRKVGYSRVLKGGKTQTERVGR